MAGQRRLEVIIAGDAKGAVSALNAVDRSSSGLGSKLAAVGKTAAVALGAGLGAAVVGAKQAVDAASSLNETLSKSNTVFKEQGTVIEQWANKAATSFGQSKQQALEAASSFGNMFIQLGIGRQEAAGMSTKMTELASDFASFHNADITEVLEAQAAAFRGEYDSVQKFVPTINAAAVEQKALEMGLAGTTKELTAQDKALATQQLLLEGAGDAMGDFSRTSDSLANKQRILSARFEDIKAKIGTALIPVAAALADLVATKVLPALEKLGPVVKSVGMFFKSLFSGFTEDEGTKVENAALGLREKLEGLVEAAKHVVEWVQANWPKIKETISQVLTTVGTIVSGFVDLVTTLWDNFGNNILEFVERVWPRISQVIEGALTIIRGIVQTITALIHGDWSGVWEGIKAIVTGAWEAIQGIIGAALEAVRAVIGVGLELIGSLFKGAWDAVIGLVTDAIKAYVQFHIELPGRIVEALAGLAGALGGVVTAAFDGAKRLAQSGVDAIVGFFSALPGRITGLAGSIGSAALSIGSTIISKLGEGLSEVAEFATDIGKAVAKAVKNAVNALIDKVNDALEFTIPGPGPLPDIHVNPPNIPHLHTGGLVSGAPGSEHLRVLQAGEGVFTPEQMRALAPVTNLKAIVAAVKESLYRGWQDRQALLNTLGAVASKISTEVQSALRDSTQVALNALTRAEAAGVPSALVDAARVALVNRAQGGGPQVIQLVVDGDVLAQVIARSSERNGIRNGLAAWAS